jgi:succinyl-CoA synthetase alpha subunit
MVGGVSPKKAGQTHLGLPVFGSVKEVTTFLFATINDQ